MLQDHLTSELRLAKATDLSFANAVLRKFIADYNRRFARNPREMQTAWRDAPDSLDRICCFLHERVVSNDNAVHWEGRLFQITQQARRFNFAGAKVQNLWLSIAAFRRPTATLVSSILSYKGG